MEFKTQQEMEQFIKEHNEKANKANNINECVGKFLNQLERNIVKWDNNIINN